MSMRSQVVCLVAFLAVVIVSCGTTPYTGRSQMLLLSNGQEAQLGLQSYQQTLSGAALSRNQAWTAMVKNAGARIAAAAADDMPYAFTWEFNLIADQTVNAFCLPGGKVAFYEGIMPVCQDEAGVAVVMGHEIAHAIARHGNERVSQNMLAEVGKEGAALLLGAEDAATRQSISAALGVGVLLPFSRKHESEADHIGLILMAKAGYDPRVAPGFWTRMGRLGSGQRPPEFLSTHPHPETRVPQLNDWMPEALQYYKPAGAGN